ncbi:MAG: nickel-dependent hydrogenase large subunit [Candidatus Diapherotrites archaeon]|nr:nickel-dependent hydrogenase large subunit [Candidatus Diapherotrites archaeon]
MDITIDQISKIEGHAEISVTVRNGEVKDVELKINENKRFYTQAVRNKNFVGVPQLVSRICGTCSVAHLNCSIMALENGLGLQLSEQDKLLRELSMHGLMIRDHAMHLYFFCAPDELGADSVMELAKTNHDLVHEAFHVKGAGNNLSKLVLGRAVHGQFAQIGYYTNTPTPEAIAVVKKELQETRTMALNACELFYKSPFALKRTTHFVALSGGDFNYLDGEIHSTQGLCISPAMYRKHLEHIVKPYSQASAYALDKTDYMTGALARLNLNKKRLHKDTQRDAKQYLSVFPSNNIFHNNLAQAIEIVHGIDRSIEILDTTEFKPDTKPQITAAKSEGIGLLEAPRGNLYYLLSTDAQGAITFADIITPSSQNQNNMENDLRQVVSQNLDQSREKIEFEMEKLILAYDPCFSCASHFLKVKWRGQRPASTR